MERSYVFMESSGCGHTRVYLAIKGDLFVILYESMWMGRIGREHWIRYDGQMIDETHGYLTSVRCSINDTYTLETGHISIGDVYPLPPNQFLVSFRSVTPHQLTDNAGPMKVDENGYPKGGGHLGDGMINMGNCANYNSYYDLEMKFEAMPPKHDPKYDLGLFSCSYVKSGFTSDPHINSDQERKRLESLTITETLHPDEKFMDRMINTLQGISYVQLGQLVDDVYQEEKYLCFKKSDLNPHEVHI